MRRLFPLLCLLVLVSQAYAKPSVSHKSRVPKPLSKAPAVTVHQEADQLDYDDKSKTMHLHGHVRLTQGDMVLEADDATYYLNTEEAQADGNLKLNRPDGILTGDHLHLYYREKRADFEGHVSLVRWMKQNRDIRENEVVDKTPVKIFADQLEYRWGEKIAAAHGSVELVQGERKATAENGEYNEPLDRLEMEGRVHLHRPPKDELDCDHLVYFLKSNQAKAEGHVHGQFVIKEHPKP